MAQAPFASPWSGSGRQAGVETDLRRADTGQVTGASLGFGRVAADKIGNLLKQLYGRTPRFVLFFLLSRELGLQAGSRPVAGRFGVRSPGFSPMPSPIARPKIPARDTLITQKCGETRVS